MKAFVISLESDKSRRSHIRGQLEKLGMEYEFFNAVRGSERIQDRRWYDPDEALKCEDRYLRSGEVGCALSHAAVYSEIVRRDLPWALVLEDDAVLHDDLISVLQALEAGYILQGDLISLGRCDHYKPWTKRPLFAPYKLVEPILVREGSTAQTVGYVITREAARAIAAVNVPVKFPADSWGYYKGKVRFLGVIPTLTLVTQMVELGSTTTSDGTRRKFEPYSLSDLLWHGFKTYNPVGKRMKKLAKKVFRR